MRKWLAVFLLIVIPMQFALAATAAYCQHEAGVATKHLGHHGHKHQAQSAELAQSDKTKSNGFDLDCGNCHAGCSLAVATAEGNSVLPGLSFIEPSTDRVLASLPLKVPDRPQWLARS
ncbi:hypothetical protein RS694_10390 [Rhodoferax saidenbachensis]|uniref:Cobalt-zinc-cadmium resistance protein n=2 Tax=Rhodoferax saidenbachensis TaxID=1484693 RepID=A0A1P8KFN6_9BURK|nr:hypothetical protein RS694_10390 [Rhodoferax saidenbachensis]